MPTVRSRSRRWWIALLVLALALLLTVYTLGGFFGVPRLVKSLAQKEVAKIGRKIEIGAVQFNPFTFEARIDALRLSEADGAPLLGFESLYVNAGVTSSIRERGAVLQELRWTAPDLALVVEADGSVNLAKLAPPSKAPDPPKEPAAVPHVRIGLLKIERGRVGIEDRSRPQPFSLALTPVEFTLADFQTALGHENVYEFSGTASTGEQLEWAGDFTVQPLGSRGRFALRNVQASTIAGYAQDLLPMQLVSGVAETAGEYRLSVDPALALELALPETLLRDLALAERGAGKRREPFAVKEIALRQLAFSLHRRELVLKELGIKGLRAEVQREADGSLNLQRLFAPKNATAKKASAPPPAEAPPTTPWRVAVSTISLDDATVDAEDRGVKPAVRLALKQMSASLGGFDTASSAPLAMSAQTGIGRGRVKAEGEVRLSPLSASLRLDVRDLDLAVVQPYLETRTGIALKSARLGVKGALDFTQRPQAAPRIGFAGEASVAGLTVQDRAAKQDLLKWRELKLSGIQFRQSPDRLDIAQVLLAEPYAKVVVSSVRELNVTRALAAPGAGKKAEAAPAGRTPVAAAKKNEAAPLAVQVKDIRIEGGTVNFADQSIEPPFAAAIMALNGRISGLSTDPKSSAKIDLKGKVDEFAPVLIQGQINPFAVARHTDVALSFRNMDLIRFNPYSGRFAGYNITKGKLTTELKYRIQDRALEAEHHVVLDQLEFGDATGSKDAVPLPVKLAVALLKDRHGVIDLGLPVRGNLDDPTFKVGPIVWKVLVNLLTKAVTAPFSALASLFGGGEELAYVEFAPGSAALSAAETEKLGKLGTALVERPALKLDVPYALSDAEDGAVLARAALEQRLQPSAPLPAELAPEKVQKRRLRALEALHEEMLGQKPAYPPDTTVDKSAEKSAQIAWLEQALTPNLLPDAAALETLANERARAVQTALLARPEIAPERLFLTSRRAATLSDAGAVRMELSLQ